MATDAAKKSAKRQLWRKRRKTAIRPPVGAPPGSMIAGPGSAPPRMTVFSYDADGMDSCEASSTSAACGFLHKRNVTWLNVDGLGDVEAVRELAAAFGIHPLAQEDIVHTYQRPKIEEYDDHVFMVIRMPQWNDRDLVLEQLGLFVGKDYVLTFQEEAGDCFEPVRARIRAGKAIVRSSGPDYLGYAIIDAIVDSYFPVLERVSDRLDQIESHILTHDSRAVLNEVYELRSDLASLRRALWPLRDTLSSLVRGEFALIRPETRVFLRDCYDHVIQLMDVVEAHRETCSSLMDLHLSHMSHRMNEVMRVLTVIATLFMPLSFIASLYGMNFDRDASPWNMPELGWYHGYPFAVTVMVVTTLLLLWFFWRKGWIGSAARREKRRSNSDFDSSE